MTLVVTDIRQSWISMAAESAVNYSAEIDLVDATGAKKLFPIYKINAGISMFGLATVKKKNQTMSKYIAEYVDWAEDNVSNIEDFSTELNNRLNNDVGIGADDSGFQVAGFVERDGKKLPTFWHISNINPSKTFTAGAHFPPEKIFETPAFQFRNGSIGVFCKLLDYLRKITITRDANGVDKLAISGLLADLQINDKITVPRDETSLEVWLEFTRFLIETVINIYRLSDQKPIIGGPVCLLGITQAGIRYYYSAPPTFRGQTWGDIITSV
ncbi:MAG: hypothetical protein NT099_04035 [Candidatus Saganbacteria bacterium]|nr:hypothetical protein [Candidatus Saganbacteria bacterium]